MESIFFSVVKQDCQEVSALQKENGLLEIIIPSDYDNNELGKYFNSLDEEEYNKIVDKQKKAKEVFRKNVNKMINKFRDEFKLPFNIKLRIQTKTKKLSDWNIDVHGIFFEGNLSLIALLQYFSDELVEKIVRNTVLSIAREYEIKVSRIQGVATCNVDFINGEIESNEFYGDLQNINYKIPLKYDEIREIISDYETGAGQIIKDMKKQPIMSI